MAKTKDKELTIDTVMDYMYAQCWHKEKYNGSTNKSVEILCSACTQKLTHIKEYQDMADQRLAQYKRDNKPLLRLGGKRKYKLKGVTLATC